MYAYVYVYVHVYWYVYLCVCMCVCDKCRISEYMNLMDNKQVEVGKEAEWGKKGVQIQPGRMQ